MNCPRQRRLGPEPAQGIRSMGEQASMHQRRKKNPTHHNTKKTNPTIGDPCDDWTSDELHHNSPCCLPTAERRHERCGEDTPTPPGRTPDVKTSTQVHHPWRWTLPGPLRAEGIAECAKDELNSQHLPSRLLKNSYSKLSPGGASPQSIPFFF